MWNISRSRLHWCLFPAGLAVVAYALVVVLVVATAPDLRLRWLLVDGPIIVQTPSGTVSGIVPSGIRIRQTAHPLARGPVPVPGDILLKVDGHPVRVSVDAARQVLRNLPKPGAFLTGANLRPEDPSRQMVPIEFWSQKTGVVERSNLLVQATPAFEIGVTLVWLVCQLGILGLGALAFWKRPFDRPARLFFSMCIVTLGAFVGAYHWWLLSGSFLLTFPFVVCAVLCPSVTLHFFLAYPQPKEIFTRWRRPTLWVLYGPPILASVAFLIVDQIVWRQVITSPAGMRATTALSALQWIRLGIYGYVGIATTYFAATLASLLHSVWTTRQVLERRQVTSILWAALLASLFIGYTLVLACWDRESFALGGARIPMFLASLVFMVAYAIGIVRYKLMLSDETLGRGFVMEGLRLAGALAAGVVVVPIALQTGRFSATLPWMPALAVGVVLLVVTAGVLSARDLIQRWLERRLFRERFRLEKALQRIHRAVGHLADPQFLSERTLAACCEVLQAEWAALYLRDAKTDAVYHLSAMEGGLVELPLVWTATPELLKALENESGLLSMYGERRLEAKSTENPTSQLPGDLIHLLEIDGEAAGLVVLGPKLAGGAYSSEDGTFLTALAQLTGVALHCVRVHQDLTQMNEQLRLKVERIAQQKQQIVLLQAELAATRPLQETAAEPEFDPGLIKGSSTVMRQVLATARKAALSDATLLIRGESGTGKELLAQAIHDNSPRHRGPLITVHCAALSPGLLESELFGHVKGAFTGAMSDREGRFQLAEGGTLFLDEIGEISQETQVKLLRVLQQREIEPVGSGRPVPVNVRVVAATHRPLEEMVADGRFREDLYYRLNVITLTLPPLRERTSDLQELAAEFLKRAAVKCDKRVVDFEEATLDALLKYDWPGNIRELENVIERAVVLSEGELIGLHDLPADLVQRAATGRDSLRRHSLVTPLSARRTADSSGGSRHQTATLPEPRRMDREAERRLLQNALQQAGGNKAQAAKLLGLPRSTFFSKLKKHSLAD